MSERIDRFLKYRQSYTDLDVKELQDEITELQKQNDLLVEALEGLLSSQALKEAPFYNYSEAILRAEEALAKVSDLTKRS